MIIRLFLFALVFQMVSPINFVLVKRNISIPNDSQYIAKVDIIREDAELIPINISLQTSIENTIPSSNNYFDYFYCLANSDVTCYSESVNNQSYLYPCPFIDNRYSVMRAIHIESQKVSQSIDELKDLSFTFIVDNTPYPYPSGAYSYSNININVELQIMIEISQNYQILGI